MRKMKLKSVLIATFFTLIAIQFPIYPSNKSNANFSITPQQDSIIQSALNLIKSESISNKIAKLTNFKTRFMLADNRKDIAEWIKNQFVSMGYDSVFIDSFTITVAWPPHSRNYYTTYQYNVICTLEGKKNPDDIYVLGAHYDCLTLGKSSDPLVISPGADNNASGVAVCLEVARILKSTGFKTKGTIQFVAFGAEEFMTMQKDGFTGSQHFVNEAIKNKKDIKFMIDNNQVGNTTDRSEWNLNFQNNEISLHITELAHNICKRYTSISPVNTNNHIGYSDSYYFWKNGYPSIFFEEYDFSPYNFTLEDTPAHIDFGYCAEVAKISCGMLLYSNFITH